MGKKLVTDFIQSKVSDLLENFSGESINVGYHFSEISQVHFVKVSPITFYNENINYIKWEERFVNEFESIFPDEMICFLSDDDCLNFDFKPIKISRLREVG
jgi:hypothetical protein